MSYANIILSGIPVDNNWIQLSVITKIMCVILRMCEFQSSCMEWVALEQELKIRSLWTVLDMAWFILKLN